MGPLTLLEAPHETPDPAFVSRHRAGGLRRHRIDGATRTGARRRLRHVRAGDPVIVAFGMDTRALEKLDLHAPGLFEVARKIAA
jgi:hypothetical protein